MKNILRQWSLLVALLFCSLTAWAGADEGMAAYQSGDYASALAEFKQAAETGDVYAQYNLGVMFALGQGVEKDEDLALKWYRKAAEKGFAPAQYSLGQAYEEAWGVSYSPKIALDWYRKAAEQDYPRAQLSLGLLYARGLGVNQDVVQAYKWFHLAALSGDALAEHNRANAEKKMTPRQIEQALTLARAWEPKTTNRKL